MIDYFSVVDETFEDSHMWQKGSVDFTGVLSVSTRDKEPVRLSYWICEAVCTAGTRYKNYST